MKMSSEAARAIVRLLQSWDPSDLVLLWRFSARAEIILVGASEIRGTGLELGDILAGAEGELLRARASDGPWLTDGARRVVDADLDGQLAAAGIQAAVFVPMNHDGRLVGLIVVGTGQSAEDAQARLAARLPVLVEVGALAESLLGPAFLKLDEVGAAAVRLDAILAAGAFRPIFQPILQLTNGEVVGFEALTRFDGALPEAVFAEAALLGRLPELEIATMSAAIEAADRLPPNRWLSVNVSPALLADTDTLRRLVRGSLRPIVLELSEHELVDDYEVLTTSIKRMEPWVSLAIDDAGAGFSSLRHVLEASPSWVKLDIGLVRGVDTDLARQALVAGLVHFARKASIALIAEGIETEAERDTLKSLGVKLGQGFFLGRPAPIDEALIGTLVQADDAGRTPSRGRGTHNIEPLAHVEHHI
jgi:EAL domain-containing protein (putative c-di-GMP-specific phosphodiesterase class I)